MLTIYRRHRAKCKMKGRRAKCSCPIWVQGILEGEEIRESLSLTSWEAAQKKARDWEIAGKKNTLMVGDAFDRFITDQRYVVSGRVTSFSSGSKSSAPLF
jgi:hypothetical protein